MRRITSRTKPCRPDRESNSLIAPLLGSAGCPRGRLGSAQSHCKRACRARSSVASRRLRESRAHARSSDARSDAAAARACCDAGCGTARSRRRERRATLARSDAASRIAGRATSCARSDRRRSQDRPTSRIIERFRRREPIRRAHRVSSSSRRLGAPQRESRRRRDRSARSQPRGSRAAPENSPRVARQLARARRLRARGAASRAILRVRCRDSDGDVGAVGDAARRHPPRLCGTRKRDDGSAASRIWERRVALAARSRLAGSTTRSPSRRRAARSGSARRRASCSTRSSRSSTSRPVAEQVDDARSRARRRVAGSTTQLELLVGRVARAASARARAALARAALRAHLEVASDVALARAGTGPPRRTGSPRRPAASGPRAPRVVDPERLAVAHDEARLRLLVGPAHPAGLREHARRRSRCHRALRRRRRTRRCGVVCVEARAQVADAVVARLDRARRARGAAVGRRRAGFGGARRPRGRAASSAASDAARRSAGREPCSDAIRRFERRAARTKTSRGFVPTCGPTTPSCSICSTIRAARL